MIRELRLGNIIEAQGILGNWYPFTLSSTYTLHDMLMDDGYRSVVLTEEWLVKSGFIPATDNMYGGWLSPKTKHDERIRIMHEETIGFFYQAGDYAEPRLVPDLHTLQNLFFALTAEELTVEL